MPHIYQMPGHLIRRLNQISVAVFADGMAAQGIDLTPVQFSALTVVSEMPGLDQATLAGAIAYDKMTIGGVLDRLEAKGMLTRRVNTRDRRARVLEATPAGQALVAKATPIVAALQDAILPGLDASERKTLMRLMKKTADAGNHLSPCAAERPPRSRDDAPTYASSIRRSNSTSSAIWLSTAFSSSILRTA